MCRIVAVTWRSVLEFLYATALDYTCSALSAKCVNILGSPNLGYEELGKVHWRALLKLAKASQLF